MILPTHAQMLLPLLEALAGNAGTARPGELYDRVAAKLNVTEEVRQAHSSRESGKMFNVFERRVRWCRQTAVMKGLISGDERAVWSLTQKANARLQNIVAGKVVYVFGTERGSFLRANAEDVVGYNDRGSVNLLMTSPPYPLTVARAYGGVPEGQWCDWMLRLCEGWRGLLTEDGSIMLNLGPVWKKGVPAQSLYIERFLVRAEDTLGLSVLQRLDWHSPTKLPAPLPWVGIERCRVTSSVEPLLWMSSNPHAFGDNRQVLRPYTAGGCRAIQRRRQGTTGPAGYSIGSNSYVDRGGSIPPSLLSVVPQGAEEVRYRRAVRSRGMEPYPAMMPAAVARFGINLATREGDLVVDPFVGSGTVAVEAMKAGRRAIGSDRSLSYIQSARIRCEVEGCPGL